MNLDASRQFKRNFGGLLESAGDSLWICDVAAEKRAAAIEFKIEVAFVRFRLEKKFHATVFPNFITVSRSHAANKTITDFENAVKAVRIVEQTRESPGAMAA